MPSPPDIDVDAAAARIAPYVRRTPVLEWDGLFVKCEHLQRTGAFKYRGATNAVQSLPSSVGAVAAHSSGNHAAALALAASVRGVVAHVVMPEGTSAFKVRAVERYGGEITWCAPTLEARRAVLADVVARTGATEIHPFENPDVIAGAGTAARELLEEVPDLDVVVTPIGGGGLCSGTVAAVGDRRVVGASPVDRQATIADGLRTGTSPLTDGLLAGVDRVTVDEAAIVGAMRTVWERAKQVIEPSAAIAFAAARTLDRRGQRVGVVCSGGNVDLDALPW